MQVPCTCACIYFYAFKYFKDQFEIHVLVVNIHVNILDYELYNGSLFLPFHAQCKQ